MKIVMKAMKWYLVANTVCLAFVGAGRHFYDGLVDPKDATVIDLIKREIGESAKGWKEFFRFKK